MPHDKHGTVIEVGDGVIVTGWDGKARVGVVGSVHPNAETCNVTAAVPILGGCESITVNADMYEVITRDGARVAAPVPGVAVEALSTDPPMTLGALCPTCGLFHQPGPCFATSADTRPVAHHPV